MNGLKSLGLRSDVMVLGALAEIEALADRVIVRTPSEPDFWFGNMVIFREGAVDPARQVALFRESFPDARHVTIAWDVPGMKPGPEMERLVDDGFEIDRSDVLALTGPSNPFAPPDGIVIRAIETAEDWEKVVALQVQTGLEDGHVQADYEPYIRKRFANRAKQVPEGWGCWFGAFDGAQLAGDLGIFAGDGTARFQDVETGKNHRRRGICAALVTKGLEWAAARAPAATPVIVAHSDGDAGRVYRRCGFTLSEQLTAAYRPPAGAKRPVD